MIIDLFVLALALGSSALGTWLLIRDLRKSGPFLTNGDIALCAILGGVPFVGLLVALGVTLLSSEWADQPNRFFGDDE